MSASDVNSVEAATFADRLLGGERCPACVPAEGRDGLALGFVDTPRSVCLSRGLARDARHRTAETDVRELWESWLLEEDRYFARDAPNDYADFVVDGTIAFEAQSPFRDRDGART